MATEVAAGSVNPSGTRLSAAQKLGQKHADEAHKTTIEDVVDEEDLKHGEVPKSTSILESTGGEYTSTPEWVQPISAKAAGKQKVEVSSKGNQIPLDTQSHDIFPKLGSAPKPQNGLTTPSIWSTKKATAHNSGAGNGEANSLSPSNGSSRASTPTSGAGTPTSTAPRITPNLMAIPGRQTERIQLTPSQLTPRSQLKKPLVDILKDINKKSKATISMTTGQGGAIWFTAVGPVDACRQALKGLVEQIGSKQSIKVQIPRSARPYIIGKQGTTIKALQEKSGARIQMPKDDRNGQADDEDDATIDVVIEGNALSAEMARVDVLKIADEKTATLSQRVRGIPAEFYPFIAGPQNERIKALERNKNINIHVPVHHQWTRQPPPQMAGPGQAPNFLPSATDNPIVLTGDRSDVQEARMEIERQAQELRRQLVLEQLAITRGRHQFIVGERGIPVHQFLADTGCAIILPAEGDDETVTIVGPPERLQGGVDRAMELASSMHSTNIDIGRQHRNAPGGAATHARNLTRYLQQRKEIRRLEELYNAHIVTPIPSTGGAASWELYSRDGKTAIRAQSEIANIISGHPPSRMANVEVDPFFHQHLRNGILPRVQEDYGVHTVIPTDSESDVPVLLVFEGPSGSDANYQVSRTQPTPSEIQQFQRSLEDARNFILDIIGGQEAITSQSIDVPEKFHDKLRKLIKQEQQDRPVDQIPVRVSSNKSIVTMRGPTSAVQALATKVEAFLVQEIEDDKERGFTMSFDFPQKHANQLVGKGGSNIRELREKFDVEIKIDNGKVELKGPKAKAEAAKSHITTLGKQWADEVTHTLKIEPKYHRELIGAGGSQINKLQSRYKVQISYPNSARPAKSDQAVADGAREISPRGPRRVQAEDEVIVRGPSRGADEARDEILSLLQYLRDISYSATVRVQQSQIPMLIGQGGKELEELRQLTSTRIDIPSSRDAKDPSGLVEIQIKGTKAQVAQAKKILEEKKQIFDQNITRMLEVDKKHHRVLIGAGGSNLREIVVKAGGSDDHRELARTVKFPRSEADGNLIKIEGNKDVVEKIVAAMQVIIARRDSEVVEIVDVPTEKHRSLIGRGGETKKTLEKRFNVTLEIPRQGSDQTGIKVSGQPSGVASAKEHLLALRKESEGEKVQVPRSLHHIIADHGQFFRKVKLEHGVNIGHGGQKIPPMSVETTNARLGGSALPLITDNQDASANVMSWNVVKIQDTDLEGEIPWILQGSPQNVLKAKQTLIQAMEQATKITHHGYLILQDPRNCRFVIGQGGNQVNSIRKQSGCTIYVPRDQAEAQPIEVSGTAEGVEKARELIQQAIKNGLHNGPNGNRA